MRRNSSDDGRRRLEAAATLLNSKNVGDLIYRYETKNDANIREMLSSPQLQHQLEMFYCKNPAPSDMRFNDLARIRYLQQQQQQQNYNDSLISLTDSEFYSDDQQQDTPYERLTNEKVVHNLTRFGKFIEMIARLPWPRMSVTGMGICFLVAVFICPRACDENLLFPAFRLLFGTLYPAYASYKAVRTKNVKEYVKWMMYWIVFAFFTCIETFTDIFLAWFPFYYEVKVIIVIWLLSPATKGSSTLYRKFVHPMLTRREQEIDEYINQAKEKGYTAVLQLGSKGVNYATNVIMQTALKGGGNLVQTIRRSYSLSDLSEPDIHRTNDEIDDVARPQRLLRPRSQTARSASGGRNVEMYFPEVDVAQKAPTPNYNYIRSSEDISSGYSSAEPISTGLSRTASMTNTTRPRFKAKRAEEDIYLESDEYEAMPEVRHPNIYSPYAYYPINPIPSSSKPQRYNTNELEDWKNQAYLDNQKYFQESVLQSLRYAKPRDIGKVDDTNTPIVEQSESIETPEEHSSKPDIRVDDDSKELNVPPAKIAEEMVDKYELFCKWLENNEKLRNERKSNNETPTPVASSTLLPQSEDEFRDTMSTGSGDELFHDTQNLDSQPQQQPALPSSLLDIVRSEKLQVLSASNISESIDSVEGDSLPSILDDFNVSRKSSTSDLKRPAVHNKGKAPEPPATSSPPSPSTEQDTTTSIALNLPETITSINTNDQSISTDDRNSRSPSPRSDSKKSTKKNLFKNYLPSLFRSESPKPNSSSDEHLKETQI